MLAPHSHQTLHLGWIWIAMRLRLEMHLCGPLHYSQDPQVQFLANFSLKLGPTALFIHLKIILLQCFKLSTISDIQTDP